MRRSPFFSNNADLFGIFVLLHCHSSIEDVDDRNYIAELVRATCKELPAQKPKVKRDKLF